MEKKTGFQIFCLYLSDLNGLWFFGFLFWSFYEMQMLNKNQQTQKPPWETLTFPMNWLFKRNKNDTQCFLPCEYAEVRLLERISSGNDFA